VFCSECLGDRAEPAGGGEISIERKVVEEVEEGIKEAEESAGKFGSIW